MKKMTQALKVQQPRYASLQAVTSAHIGHVHCTLALIQASCCNIHMMCLAHSHTVGSCFTVALKCLNLAACACCLAC
jgi:hypothetical protein